MRIQICNMCLFLWVTIGHYTLYLTSHLTTYCMSGVGFRVELRIQQSAEDCEWSLEWKITHPL